MQNRATSLLQGLLLVSFCPSCCVADLIVRLLVFRFFQAPERELGDEFRFSARRQQVIKSKQIYRVHHTLDYK